MNFKCALAREREREKEREGERERVRETEFRAVLVPLIRWEVGSHSIQSVSLEWLVFKRRRQNKQNKSIDKHCLKRKVSLN